MNTIQDLFQQAQLTEAAYANFFNDAGVLATDDNSVKAALQNEGFSTTQAAAFVAQWRVIDQYTAPSTLGVTGTGFSATVFQNIATGAYTLAIRGSTDINDFVADAQLIFDTGIAAAQLVDLYNYWQRLTTPVYEHVRTAKIVTTTDGSASGIFASTTVTDETGNAYQLYTRIEFENSPDYGLGLNLGNLDVTGHSLGGHLAMAFTRLFPSVASNAIVVNGLGFKLDNGTVNNLFAALGGATSFTASQIQNVYGIAGPEFASMNNFLLQQPGGYDGIYIENASPLPPIYGGHGVSQMVDSLAVYNLFAMLAPNLNTDPNGLAKITGILKATSNVAANSLESAVSDLGKLFSVAGASFTGNEFDSNRELLYSSLDKIKDKLLDAGGVQLVSLADPDANNPSTLIAKANQSGAEGMAYRYALANLNPFVFTDSSATLYEAHDQNGELDLYDPNATTNPSALTEQYLTDRAAMLAAVIQANTNDAGAVIVNSGDSFTYQDVERNLTLDVLNTANFGGLLPPLQYKVIFGGNNGDTLTGTNGNDRIYDGSGNDTLNGGVGGDYLEGGRGDDVYVDLNEHDTVLDVQGNDSYQLTGNADATITDVDGIGDIAWDGTPVTGGSLQSGDTNADGAVWQSADGVFTYTRSGADLFISKSGDAGYATLKHFNFIDAASGLGSNDTLGISFSGAAARSGHALTSDSDTYDTAPGETAVLGLDGNDIITVTTPYVPGASVFGGDGNDSLYVEDAQDYSAALLQGGTAALPDPTARGVDLFGEGGNDFIEGSLKADTLNGGDGVNWLSGLFGDDTLIGGPRTDLLHGNADTDFLFSSDQLYREAA